ncbi:MAG TPA: acetyl-CoA carboxylase biotin carboxyl carrier protein [Candidatus Limnocylindria bacterium]|nr:acetyl-CoA carboxylase biotin carboxyl carrier protein [Candidatus Limnocylindria bacterium]
MAKRTKPQPPVGKSSRGVDLTEVERLLAFMDKHGLEEFGYERDGVRIRLKRPSTQAQGAFRGFPAPDILVAGGGSPPAHHASPEASAPTAIREPVGEAGRSEDLHVVKSPIVGTYYASASPGSEPFVTVGAHVETGHVLCIIEAMKLMNEIESDVAGEVVRIFVENGQPVEYGEPLFGIHPHRKK